jgi:methionyl-tRNA formyltransferase
MCRRGGSTSVVFFGYGPLAVAGIDALAASGATPAAVVLPSNRSGSDVDLVRAHAEARHISILVQPPRTASATFVDHLRALAPDAIVVWSYSMVLPETVLSIPPRGAVNVHGGLLPEYRGPHVLQWALINGERETGVTLHYVDAGIDTGPLIAQSRIPIAADDDAVSVKEKMAVTGAALLRTWWPRIADGTAPRTPQDESRARRWPARKSVDGLIDWSQPAAAVCRLVRALSANRPGAYFEVEGRPVSILRAITVPSSGGSTVPGRVTASADRGLRVRASDADVLVLEAFVNGRVVDGAALADVGHLVSELRSGR